MPGRAVLDSILLERIADALIAMAPPNKLTISHEFLGTSRFSPRRPDLLAWAGKPLGLLGRYFFNRPGGFRLKNLLITGTKGSVVRYTTHNFSSIA